MAVLLNEDELNKKNPIEL